MNIPNNTLTCLPNHQLRAQGEAILRISSELRPLITDDVDLDPDTRASVLADLDKLDEAGNWLRGASSISLGSGQSTTVELKSYTDGPRYHPCGCPMGFTFHAELCALDGPIMIQ